MLQFVVETIGYIVRVSSEKIDERSLGYMNDSRMIQIAVCDDEETMTNRLIRLIEEILSEQNVIYKIRGFQSGKELIEKAEEFDVAFLDIEMPEINGIETGQEILRRNKKCRIIIASAREERFKETYKIETLRFISKPFAREEVAEALDAFLNRQIGMKKIEVYKDRNVYWIRERDIQYIRAYNNYVEIIADDIVYRRDISLNTLENILDGRCFIRIHRQYIVNLRWVTHYQKGEARIGDFNIPISRRMQKEFEMAYIKFEVKYR